MRKVLKKARKGTTLVETVIALMLLALAVVVMTALTGSKVDQQYSMEAQYSLQAVDAFMYSVYTDFHNCETFVITETGSGGASLLFDMGNSKSTLYEYRASEKKVYIQGVEAFSCSNLIAHGAGNSLYLAVRLPSERILEMDIFK